jgi:hypothetical protein
MRLIDRDAALESFSVGEQIVIVRRKGIAGACSVLVRNVLSLDHPAMKRAAGIAKWNRMPLTR